MKVLIVHNDYGIYTGEEAVVDRMIADGKRGGLEIATLRLSSKNLRDTLPGKIRGFFAGIWSFKGRRMMRKSLRTFKPDIVQIHNLYPFISPAVLPLCHKAGIPVIMTVHNYRLICPTGLFLRDGKPCENCLRNGNERDCIRYNCEHNLFRSIGFAIRNMVARRTKAYLDNVDYFCCLTDFQKQKLIDAGFAPEHIKVIPNYMNFIEAEEPSEVTEACGNGYIGFVGRLSPEKGYDMLFEVARRHPEMEFRTAGLIRDNEQIVFPDNVKHCGKLSPEQLARFYENASFIVVPSRCYEGFPMVLLEASSHGRCCLVPNHGAFPELITDPTTGEIGGLLFNPLDVDDLEQKTVTLWNDKDLNVKLSNKAKKICQERFSRKKITQTWDTFLKEIVK